MLILAIQGGHVETMRRLLDAGARIDGNPEGGDDPLGQACWRGRAEMVHELVERGAALTFRDGGSAMGAALHGSRHCSDPEGGPSMRLVEEIPAEPYTRSCACWSQLALRCPRRTRSATRRFDSHRVTRRPGMPGHEQCVDPGQELLVGALDARVLMFVLLPGAQPPASGPAGARVLAVESASVRQTRPPVSAAALSRTEATNSRTFARSSPRRHAIATSLGSMSSTGTYRMPGRG